MFSGIVQRIGTVESLISATSGAELAIRSDLFFDASDLVGIGDSIAINGVCLTVTELKAPLATFDISSETLRATNLGKLKTGNLVNLERALKVGDRLDGHLVLGHVDTVASLRAKHVEGETIVLDFILPEQLVPYITGKGSICIDGVSLTVGTVNNDSFSIYVIPHTAEQTTLGSLQCGQKVNLEIDCIARYAVHALAAKFPGAERVR